MFALHETTRRRLCRAGFVLLCVVPTVCVAAWTVWLRRPEHRDLLARELSERLGLSVSLLAVRHPRPHVTLFEGVDLSDPETGTRLAHARLVEVDATDDGLKIQTFQAEIDAVPGAWRDLLDRELRRGGSDSDRFSLACGDVTLRMPSGDQTLTEVRCQFESAAEGRQASCSFRLAGYEMPDPATMRVLRNRQTAPPTADFEMNTGGATLAGGLLEAAWPPAARLGSHCRFRGALRATETAAGWDGEMAGQLFNVELDDLVTAQFPHKLSGQAELIVERLRFRGGRIEQATGTLSAGPGLIGRSLLKAAGDGLGLVPAGEIKTLGQSVPYEQLAAAFSLDEHGLAVRGLCGEPAAPGAMLRDRTSALMLEPERASQPMVNLVRTLVPTSDVQVPATRESDALLRLLPIPEMRPLAAAEGSPAPTQTHGLRIKRGSERR